MLQWASNFGQILCQTFVFERHLFGRSMHEQLQFDCVFLRSKNYGASDCILPLFTVKNMLLLKLELRDL